MHRLTTVMCGLILGTGLVPAFAPPAEGAQKTLQGTWTATKAERDGIAADDVVGHRLSLSTIMACLSTAMTKCSALATDPARPSIWPTIAQETTSSRHERHFS